jgi:hypothetical protein
LGPHATSGRRLDAPGGPSVRSPGRRGRLVSLVGFALTVLLPILLIIDLIVAPWLLAVRFFVRRMGD